MDEIVEFGLRFGLAIVIIALVLPFIILGVRVYSYFISPTDYILPPGEQGPPPPNNATTVFQQLTRSNDDLSAIFADLKNYYTPDITYFDSLWDKIISFDAKKPLSAQYLDHTIFQNIFGKVTGFVSDIFSKEFKPIKIAPV